jgi:hypothetical protein
MTYEKQIKAKEKEIKKIEKEKDALKAKKVKEDVNKFVNSLIDWIYA